MSNISRSISEVRKETKKWMMVEGFDLMKDIAKKWHGIYELKNIGKKARKRLKEKCRAKEKLLNADVTGMHKKINSSRKMCSLTGQTNSKVITNIYCSFFINMKLISMARFLVSLKINHILSEVQNLLPKLEGA